MTLSIVIPCYNESGNIPATLARLRETIGDRADVEILLVNNGSTDNSGAIFERELGALADVRFRLVDVPVNKGYGFGILSGLSEAMGDVLAWTHADLQTDPKDVLDAYALFLGSGDDKTIVKGKRMKRAPAEAFFTFGMQMISSAALGVGVDDVNAQPKLFPRAFWERYLMSGAPDDFSLDLYLLYRARVDGWHILTIPVIFAKRLHGEAKGGGSWKTRKKLIARTFAYIFELRRKVKAETGAA